MNDHSELTATTLGFVYPFIMILGLYIIVNGHVSPGGGFQGGAVLSALFISKYLIIPIMDTRLHYIQLLEKWLLILILCVPFIFIFYQMNLSAPAFNVYYLVAMNMLIGFKVACGMSVIFLRFVFYEMQ